MTLEDRIIEIEKSFATIMESLNVMDGLCDDRDKQRRVNTELLVWKESTHCDEADISLIDALREALK